MKAFKAAIGFGAVILGFDGMASAQTPLALPPSLAVQAEGAAYADVADLVTISPLIIDATIRNLQKIAPEQALSVPADKQRMLVEADVTSLIRGQGGITPRVRFLLDVPKDAKGKFDGSSRRFVDDLGGRDRPPLFLPRPAQDGQ